MNLIESNIIAPVLFITFNRPDTTKIVFERIREAKPSKLYVAVDGPRSYKEGENALVTEVRTIVKNVDWECESHFLIREENLGCGLGPSGAISWAFETTDRLIIIEDDCLPVMPFFTYCDTLLEKYKNDSRVCMISGNNYTESVNNTADSYFFSLYGHIWGWATWKRAWAKFDYEMSDWPLFRSSNQINNVFNEEREQQYFVNFYDNFFSKKDKGTWDYQWGYCRIKENWLSIIPNHNLVTNIGVDGIHTRKKLKEHFFHVDEKFRIINEPLFVLRNVYYDKKHFIQWINKKEPILIRIGQKIKSIVERLKRSNA